MATTLAERMSNFSGSPTSALIAKVAELKRQGVFGKMKVSQKVSKKLAPQMA